MILVPVADVVLVVALSIDILQLLSSLLSLLLFSFSSLIDDSIRCADIGHIYDNYYYDHYIIVAFVLNTLLLERTKEKQLAADFVWAPFPVGYDRFINIILVPADGHPLHKSRRREIIIFW